MSLASRIRPKQDSGFTLIELVMALAVIGLILGATASTVMFTARALPADPAHGPEAELAAARGLAMLERDLSESLRVTLWSDTRIELEIQDTNGDGQPELVRYEWSRAPGGPLLRCDGVTLTTIIPAVADMGLDASIHVEQIPGGTELIEGPVEVLGGYTLTNNASSSTVRNSVWPALTIKPRFASDVESWRVTAVRVFARRTLLSTLVLNAGVNVDVRSLVNDQTPSASVLETRLLRFSLLSTLWSWNDLAFASSHNLGPDSGVAVVLRPAAVDNIIEVGWVASGVPDASAAAAVSTDGGTNWSSRPSGTPVLQVLGRVTRKVPTIESRGRLERLSILIDVPPGQGSSIRRTFSVPSLPLCPLSPPDKDEVGL